jgi:hypothetical protein
MNPTWKGRYLLVTRLLAPLCVALALLVFYDLATPATRADAARVIAKVQRTRRGWPVYTVEAKGRYAYRKDVSARIFRTIQVGDTLRVSLSPVFTEWKTLEVVRNGRVVVATRGPELYGMAAMGLFFLVGLAAVLPERLLFTHQLLVITVPVLDFTALLFGYRLVLVWMGQIEKM